MIRSKGKGKISLVKLTVKCLIVVSLLATFTGLSFGAERPAQFPERIILNLTADPAHSMAVTWRTNDINTKTVARILPANAAVKLVPAEPNIVGVSEVINPKNDSVAIRCHSVVFKNLQPNTFYNYQVGDGNVWSEWSQFKTASDKSEPFSFLFFGDPQNQLVEYVSRVFRQAYRAVPTAAFGIITGDLVTDPRNDDEWRDFYYAAGWIPREMPFVMVPGNHEYYDGADYRTVTPLWRPQFTLPENGLRQLAETSYFVDYQGLRLVCLNGNIYMEEQAVWLDSLLSTTSADWIVLAFHQPLYNTGTTDRDNEKARKLYEPIFAKYQVDLVLQGHDHVYGRSYPIVNGKIAEKGVKGTVYVVSVSGPKSYAMNSKFTDKFVKMGTGQQLYQVIKVCPKELDYRCYTTAGELYDSFTLEK
ncbi:MAG: metallophosphoesterase family protein [Candidatus Marinimicrobia bacterium]|nr:metallophosphoesterase family protein [Candidatus Neomarinimicrobiota bacterium]